ncbi:hypothetical protein Peur_035807 [Populus x canadensis]
MIDLSLFIVRLPTRPPKTSGFIAATVVPSTKNLPPPSVVPFPLPNILICTQKKTILSVEDIIALIGDKCGSVIGQTLFAALSRAGGKAFSNMAVGYNNVDVSAANKYGVAVGNTHLMVVCSVIAAYGEFLKASGEQPVAWKRAASMDEVLREAEVVGYLCCLTNGLKFDLSFQIIRTAIGVHCR